MNIYIGKENGKVAEYVEIVVVGDKSVTNKIKILRELSWSEVLELSNSGNRNSGYRNSGDSNSGDSNSGNRNSGCFNSCNYEAGFFNSTDFSGVRIFNNLTAINRKDFLENDGVKICDRFQLKSYKQKLNGKKIRKIHSYKNSWIIFWNKLTQEEKEHIKNIPYFNACIFYDITGIKI